MFPFWIEFEVTDLVQSTAVLVVGVTWLMMHLGRCCRA